MLTFHWNGSAAVTSRPHPAGVVHHAPARVGVATVLLGHHVGHVLLRDRLRVPADGRAASAVRIRLGRTAPVPRDVVQLGRQVPAHADAREVVDVVGDHDVLGHDDRAVGEALPPLPLSDDTCAGTTELAVDDRDAAVAWPGVLAGVHHRDPARQRVEPGRAPPAERLEVLEVGDLQAVVVGRRPPQRQLRRVRDALTPQRQAQGARFGPSELVARLVGERHRQAGRPGRSRRLPPAPARWQEDLHPRQLEPARGPGLRATDA